MGGDDLNDGYFEFEQPILTKKRSIATAPSVNDDGGNKEGVSKKKNKRRKNSSEDDIDNKILVASPELQAQYLSKIYRKALLGIGATASDETAIDDLTDFEPDNFVSLPSFEFSKDGYAPYIREVVSSMKVLKKWTGRYKQGESRKDGKVRDGGSPMVIIICISARRCVEVLKEIATLKIRVAKLFAKHMSLDDQKRMLSEDCPPIAVGTPARLLKLAEEERALLLDRTEVVVLDMKQNVKNFNVCTLPETSVDLAKFIFKTVRPKMEQRKKELRFGMF
mmetsp:Transcript_9932/g.22168  ORF Transcript_9932/g.22168 Transcript_9932/m.22168 type:complete len:279 (-) Transcript_9932:153-989(-)